MSNSPLVSYTKLSPCNSGQRTMPIDRITPHVVVGQLSVETIGACFDHSSAQASCNYGIGSDGRVMLCVPENQRSWCSSSSANDQRAVTIECASDKTDPYAVNNTVYNRLIDLCVDICQRNGKSKLLWLGGKGSTSADKAACENYNPKSDEMLLTAHRFWAQKSCPGPFLYQRFGDIATKVTQRLGGQVTPVEEIKYKVRLSWADEKSQKGAFIKLDKAKECADENPGYSVYDIKTQKAVYTSKDLPSVDAAIAKQSKANSLALLATLPTYKGLPDSKEDYINKVSELAVKLYPYTRFLPSVLTAQACLENGMGVASDAIELTKRSNLIGQKSDLLNSTWQDQTVWDGRSFVKNTPEVYNGVPVRVNASFRVFPSYSYSLLDYVLFITHAKINGNKYKYRDVLYLNDPEKMIKEIAGRGYCTGLTYPTSIMRIINQYDLTKYDKQAFKLLQDGEYVIPTPTPSEDTTTIKYKVGTDIKSDGTVVNQVGAFVYLDKAKEMCDEYGMGYKVFQMSDKSVVYKSTKQISAVEKAVQWALNIAADPSHGYDQNNRWGPNYDCSSLVISAFEQAGIKVKTAGATYTGNMYPAFTKCGFKDVTSKINLSNGSGLVRGDVLLNKVKHTAIYIGNGQIVHASRNEKGGATGGASGDQDGKEICTRSYYSSPWDCVLRYPSSEKLGSQPTPAPTPLKTTVYRVQVGVFSTVKKRDKLIKKIKKKLNYDCFYEDVNGQYYTYCGSFSFRATAEQRVKELKAKGIDAFVKAVKV